ncbi:insulinase family protein [Limnobacter humi]|uniref:Insulinase family protein n=1 Tax=Limnobacter humi TaxID=1778671 RepID=A0ABT1WIT3_9BURK|nr:pitrilysin family protein [Limnobacter humi]MCQ8897417.1 insulinase family protein [Limnobacter humi]
MKHWMNPLKTALAVGFVALSAQANAALPIETWKTDSGAKVMYMRAEALPILDLRIDFFAGNRADPANKVGLASATADMIGRGAEGLDENRIADGFADTGAVFGSAAGEDSAGLQLRTLTSEPEFSKSIALFKTVLQKPVFDAQVYAREQARSIAGLKEALTKPDTLAQRAFSQALYPQHPYGYVETEQSIKAVSIEDIRQFYKTHYLGNAAVVSIVGNISRAQAEKLANELTATLPTGTLAEPALGSANAAQLQAQMQGKTIQIDHPAAQSHILMGLPTLARGNPQYFDLLVANHVLGGGGFNSRLMNEIREKRGLAYSAYSYFMPSGDAGPFQAGVQTKREQTGQALELMRKTILDFITKGPSADELKAAKANLVGGFPLRVDSNSKLITNISMMGLYNLPLDYLDTWTANIDKVTVDSARKAFANAVKADKLVTVVVGGQPK